ncbi:general stress protein A [Spirochaetia bacterium]|nr:general stress protein A [Spirochaetia bacterium]
MMNTSIPVFLSSDDNYAPFVAVTIASICYNTKSFIDFYILDGSISESNKNQIEMLKERFKNLNIEFLTIDSEKVWADCYKGYSCSLAKYNVWLIPYLKPNLDKVIYLDADVIALGDILELYQEDLGGYVLGAVYDIGYINKMHLALYKNKVDLIDSHKCFNAGVLLIDCKRWLDNKTTRKLLKIESKYRECKQNEDQSILNKCFENNYKALDLKYNCFAYYKNYDDYIMEYFGINKGFICNASQECVIRHFTGGYTSRPWQYNYSIDPTSISLYPLPNFADFWVYAKMTAFYDQLHEKYNKNQTQYRGKLLACLSQYKKLDREEIQKMVTIRVE